MLCIRMWQGDARSFERQACRVVFFTLKHSLYITFLYIAGTKESFTDLPDGILCRSRFHADMVHLRIKLKQHRRPSQLHILRALRFVAVQAVTSRLMAG